ncbi:MAG: hypothetical protein KC996_12140 [Phycisphaerales bacterium]|nr:hypothetical protein [Phycisphaerales bacterium]
MPDLGYALDALYSAGWWPGETQRCVQAPDGRWMPEHEEILGAFGEAGYQIRLRVSEDFTHSRIEWTRWGGVRGSAIGRGRTEALLIAYAELLRASPLTPQIG